MIGGRCRPLISAKGREYREEVVNILKQQDIPLFSVPVRISYTFHRGDRRKYDIGNYLKALDDALEDAGVLVDDSLIEEAHLYKGEVMPRDGHVLLNIEEIK